jgi:6-phosphogluconate dehydrogenase
MTDKQGCDIGLIGLGVMGQNLVLNMADQGFTVAAYDRKAEKIRKFKDEKIGRRDIQAGNDLEEFIGRLRRPRAVIMLVPAGAPVDEVIGKLQPLVEEGDLLIDGGNSHFSDTDRRGKAQAEKGLLYLGMGISGGEYGARHGPSMMPGGPRKGYERVKAILEKAAAKVDEEPCVTYLGQGSAGHYVKMVHNGIEYGIEQLIAESYDLMHVGLGLNNDELHEVFSRWNKQEPASFLIEITADIFTKEDDQTGERVVDIILDIARQKGTGIWTAQEAKDLRVPAPTVDIAVIMRCLSEFKDERKRAAETLKGPEVPPRGDREAFIDKIKNALYAATIVTYAQGFALLRRASDAHGYDLDLEAVARIWRGGCIIRAALLERIRAAYQVDPRPANLLLDPTLGQEVVTRQADWREVVQTCAEWGIPAPGLMVSLAYFDGYRRSRLPANLTQAQRDYFGAHTYERIDRPGTFHTQWIAD